VRLILSPFSDQLTDGEKSYGNFMQDNVVAHTANNSMYALDEFFGRVICRGLRPPRSVCLYPCDVFAGHTDREKSI
jgi:hypothetical protein